MRMAIRTIHVLLPGELNGFVERKISGGRYHDASEVIRDALRRMEAAELAEDLRDFERAFAGGRDRPETAGDIHRVQAAVKTARKR
jgi:putative addiction module CopG family antidote